MYCTACNRPCETAPINLGPVTEADHRLLRDSYTEEEYSTCCEAQVSRFKPEPPPTQGERPMTELLEEQMIREQPEPSHPNQATIDGLLAMVEFLRQHPQPFTEGHLTMDFFGQTKEQIVAAVRLCGGQVKKNYAGDYFWLTKEFGGGVKMEWNCPRQEVCEKVKVGEKVVPAQPERVEEVFEWKCHDSILRPA